MKLLLVLVITLCLSLAGCGKGNDKIQKSQETTNSYEDINVTKQSSIDSDNMIIINYTNGVITGDDLIFMLEQVDYAMENGGFPNGIEINGIEKNKKGKILISSIQDDGKYTIDIGYGDDGYINVINVTTL